MAGEEHLPGLGAATALGGALAEPDDECVAVAADALVPPGGAAFVHDPDRPALRLAEPLLHLRTRAHLLLAHLHLDAVRGSLANSFSHRTCGRDFY